MDGRVCSSSGLSGGSSLDDSNKACRVSVSKVVMIDVVVSVVVVVAVACRRKDSKRKQGAWSDFDFVFDDDSSLAVAVFSLDEGGCWFFKRWSNFRWILDCDLVG